MLTAFSWPVAASSAVPSRPPRAFPSLGTFQKRFERWDDALVFAGLKPRDGRHNKVGCGRRRSPRRISDREFAIAFREGYLALGAPFRQTAYSRCRDEQARRDRAERRYRRLPV